MNSKKFFSDLVKYIAIIISIFLILILQGCQYASDSDSSGPTQILLTAELLYLEWDKPSPEQIDENFTAHQYRVYYRKHGSLDWKIIKEVPHGEQLRVELRHEDFGNGLYDFAVQSVDKHGIQSAFHTSLDPNSEPSGGWYLNWMRAE